jgi:hypothetical protein
MSKCKQGHALQPFVLKETGHSCDKCEKDIPKGASIYGCQKCEFDLCSHCSKRGADEGVRALVCKSKHPLKRVTMVERGHSCDKCEEDLPKGTSAHSCVACEYDLCDVCAGEFDICGGFAKNVKVDAGERKLVFKNNIPVRHQWDGNQGYCGELSTICSGMMYGT